LHEATTRVLFSDENGKKKKHKLTIKYTSIRLRIESISLFVIGTSLGEAFSAPINLRCRLALEPAAS